MCEGRNLNPVLYCTAFDVVFFKARSVHLANTSSGCRQTHQNQSPESLQISQQSTHTAKNVDQIKPAAEMFPLTISGLPKSQKQTLVFLPWARRELCSPLRVVCCRLFDSVGCLMTKIAFLHRMVCFKVIINRCARSKNNTIHSMCKVNSFVTHCKCPEGSP